MVKQLNSRAKKNLRKLPKECWSVLPSSGALIKIRKGEDGYHPMGNLRTKTAKEVFGCDSNDQLADLLNEKMGISKAQRMAMEIGSMSGWDVPGADPDVIKESFSDETTNS